MAFQCLNMGFRRSASSSSQTPQADLPIDPATSSHPPWIWSWCSLFFLVLHLKSLKAMTFKDEQGNSLVRIAPSFCRMLGYIVLSPVNVYTLKLLKWSPSLTCTVNNTSALQLCHKTQGPGKPKDSPYSKAAKKSLEYCCSMSFCTRLFWNSSLFTMFATHFSLVLSTYNYTFFSRPIL